MTTNELWKNGPQLICDDNVFSLGTDSVLLSAFAPAATARRVMDIGCGSGIIGLLLAWNNPSASVDGIELQAHAAELAERNAQLNALSERLKITHADIRTHRVPERAGYYDLIVSNPPYFSVGTGKAAENAHIAAARDERTLSLDELCAAAAYYAKWGGKFALVHRPERLSEIFVALNKSGFEAKRLRLVVPRAGSAPSLVLIEARRGGNAGLTIEPELVIYDKNGEETEEIKRIYHRNGG